MFRDLIRKLLGAGKDPAPGARPSVAVLYDCENVGPACFDSVMEAAEREGDVVTTRLYGPAPLLGCKSWRSLAETADVQPVSCDGSRSGKNSADIALTVDAMDLARDGAVSAVLIVSSDSDYLPLVRRLRSHGVRVCGAGPVSPDTSYAPECDSWTVLEAAYPVAVPSGTWSKHAGDWALLDLLEEAVTSTAGESGWSDLGSVAQRIARLDPSFDVSDHGCSSLKALLREVGEYDLMQSGGPCRVRRRRTLR